MADQEPYIYTIALQVRNYECDMEGIVNNAVYLNYLEHARHQFLRSAGIDFAELTQQGIHRSSSARKSTTRSHSAAVTVSGLA